MGYKQGEGSKGNHSISGGGEAEYQPPPPPRADPAADRAARVSTLAMGFPDLGTHPWDPELLFPVSFSSTNQQEGWKSKALWWKSGGRQNRGSTRKVWGCPLPAKVVQVSFQPGCRSRSAPRSDPRPNFCLELRMAVEATEAAAEARPVVGPLRRGAGVRRPEEPQSGARLSAAAGRPGTPLACLALLAFLPYGAAASSSSVLRHLRLQDWGMPLSRGGFGRQVPPASAFTPFSSSRVPGRWGNLEALKKAVESVPYSSSRVSSSPGDPWGRRVNRARGSAYNGAQGAGSPRGRERGWLQVRRPRVGPQAAATDASSVGRGRAKCRRRGGPPKPHLR